MRRYSPYNPDPNPDHKPDEATADSKNELTHARADQASLPSAEPLLAGTLALMTSYAQPCCEEHSVMILKKIIENLCRLAQHPAASSTFQTTVANLGTLWTKELDAFQPLRATPATQAQPAPVPAQLPWPPKAVAGSELWHITPETVQ